MKNVTDEIINTIEFNVQTCLFYFYVITRVVPKLKPKYLPGYFQHSTENCSIMQNTKYNKKICPKLFIGKTHNYSKV